MNTIKAIYWRLYAIRLSLRWVLSLNIGDEVCYEGRIWQLNQGVRAPVWTLVQNGESIDAHESDFVKLHGPVHWWRSFRSGYRFYMGYWYAIWMREGILPWMRECNIWKGKPPND